MSDTIDQILKGMRHLYQLTSEIRDYQSLGFGSYRPLYIGNKESYFWYFVDVEENQHIPVKARTLTCKFHSIGVEEMIRRGKPTDKLCLYVESNPENLKLISGVESAFSKSLLKSMVQLKQHQDIRHKFTIKVKGGNEGTVFPSLYDKDDNWVDTRNEDGTGDKLSDIGRDEIDTMIQFINI